MVLSKGHDMLKTDYVFQATEEGRELQRLQMLERIFDAGTQRRMLATGLTTAGTVWKWGREPAPLCGGWNNVSGHPAKWWRSIRTRDSCGGAAPRPLIFSKAISARRIFRSPCLIWCMRATS